VKEDNVRRGFLEEEDFLRQVQAMDDDLKPLPVARTMRVSGAANFSG
jgi:hypothetical protein